MVTQRVRIAALKFLFVLPQVVRYDVLHPQKAHVLRELSKVLDDPKRSVRKEAVDARYVSFCLLCWPTTLTILLVKQNKLVKHLSLRRQLRPTLTDSNFRFTYNG